MSAQDAELTRKNRFVNKDVTDFQDANASPIEGYELLTISTLEEAVQRIISIVPKLLDYVTAAKKNCKRDSTILTIDESASIYLYTMGTGFYSSLNRALRVKDRHELKPWFGFLKLFITALNKLPSVQTIVWRGVNTNVTFDFIEDELQTWWSVNSCSKCIDIIQPYLSETGTIFNIQVINGKDVHTYSAFEVEDEIILVPGTRLRVKSKPLNYNNSLFIVQLEEEKAELVPKIQ
ncbi:unnamed protein product, partial [Rotaria sp. Silwood2]